MLRLRFQFLVLLVLLSPLAAGASSGHPLAPDPSIPVWTSAAQAELDVPAHPARPRVSAVRRARRAAGTSHAVLLPPAVMPAPVLPVVRGTAPAPVPHPGAAPAPVGAYVTTLPPPAAS